MRYIIDKFDNSGQRYDTETDPYKINEDNFVHNRFVIVSDEIMKDHHRVDTYEDWEGFIQRIERSIWLSHNKDGFNKERVEKDHNTDINELIEKTVEEKPISKVVSIIDAVDPDHYKHYVGDLQWLDAMSRIPTLRDPIKFKAALELQIRKYLDRNGSKDEELQELKKARFYLQYLISYIENNCEPVYAEEVHKQLRD